MLIRRALFIELWALIVLTFSACILAQHLALPDWKSMFFLDGDSLTLPLLMKTLLSHEPFTWVSSAQSMLFPEFIIYSVCYVLTPSIEWSLLLNALINLVLLYWGLRGLTSMLALGQSKQVFIALSTCILFIGLMSLEEQPQVAIATFYLFNTYYCGIILIGLYLLNVFIRLVIRESPFKKKLCLLIILPILVTALTVFSNPMLIVQVLMPLAILCFVLWLSKIISWYKALALIISGVTASALGFIGRIWAVDYIGQSLTSHLGSNDSYQSLRFLIHFFKSRQETWMGTLFLLILLVGLFCCINYSIFYLVKKRNGINKCVYFILASFALLQALCCCAVFIISGKTALRYYLPLTLFPLLGFWPLFSSITWPRYISIYSGLVAVIFGFYSLPQLINLSSANLPELQCLNKALAGAHTYGVADYWAARALNIYGSQKYQLLQITLFFKIVPWQDNTAHYKNKSPDFIVVTDNLRKGWYRQGISGDEVKFSIGVIENQVSCGPITVLFLDKSKPEYAAVNERIHSSYRAMMALKKEHQLSRFFNG